MLSAMGRVDHSHYCYKQTDDPGTDFRILISQIIFGADAHGKKPYLFHYLTESLHFQCGCRPERSLGIANRFKAMHPADCRKKRLFCPATIDSSVAWRGAALART